MSRKKIKASGVILDNDGYIADVQGFYKYLGINELVFEKPVTKEVQ